MIEIKPSNILNTVNKIFILFLILVTCYFLFLDNNKHDNLALFSTFGVFILLFADFIKDLKRNVLPISLGIFAFFLFFCTDFYLKRFQFATQIKEILYVSGIILLFFGFRAFFPSSGENGKLEIFRKENRRYSIYYLFIVFSVLTLILFVKNTDFSVILFSVAVFACPCVSRVFFAGAEKGIAKKYGAENLYVLKKLSKIKTVAFSLSDFYTTKTETSYLQIRQTVNRDNVINIINALKPELLSDKDKLLAATIELSDIKNEETKISAKGINDTLFILTSEIPENETGDFIWFLLKDEQVLAKIFIEYQTNEQTNQAIEALDDAGVNAVLLCAENRRVEKKIENYDKIYSNLNTANQKEILQKLTNKAPVVYCGTNILLQNTATLDFNNLDFIPLISGAEDVLKTLKSKNIFLWVYYIVGLPVLYFFPMPVFAAIFSFSLTLFVNARAKKNFAE